MVDPLSQMNFTHMLEKMNLVNHCSMPTERTGDTKKKKNKPKTKMNTVSFSYLNFEFPRIKLNKFKLTWIYSENTCTIF